MSSSTVAIHRARDRVAVAVTFLLAALAAAQLAAVPAHGAAAAVNEGLAERPQLADLIEQVKPAVVNISVTRPAPVARLRGRAPFDQPGTPMDEFLERFFGQRGPMPMPGPEAQALGSGFIIDADGYVVTNHHVVAGAGEVTVTLQDGSQYPAEIVGVDDKTDLALLRIDAKGLPYARFGDSDAARVGEWVVAIGNPFGLGGTATAGIISARGRDLRSGPYDDFIQIDAPINQGNSGGPVFAADGRVIGVNTLIYSPNGGNVGIGFAIPARQAEQVVAALREHGTVSRGWLGVQIQPVTPEIARSLSLDKARGALVADVMPDSPAQAGGIEVGDVVLEFDGKLIEDPKDLSRAVADAATGKRVRVQVWRDNATEIRNVRIAASNDAASTLARADATRDLGLALAPVDERARAMLPPGAPASGVLVTGVAPDSDAARKGIRPGDVIARVNRTDVSTPAEVAAEVERARGAQSANLLMLVRNGEGQRFVSIDLG